MTEEMQLGFSAWAMPQLPLKQQIAIVRDAGYTAVELVSGPELALDPQQLDAQGRRQLRHLLDDAGLTLPSVVAHGNLLGADPERRASQRSRILAGIELAADLAGAEGTPCVVTMAYGRPEGYGADRETIAANMSELAEIAGQRGVVIALEPHVGQSFDLPEKVQWLMEQVNSPHFRLNFDNSHFEVMGRDVAEYVPLLAPYAVHTHVKDQRGVVPGYEFLVPGEGDFDYARYLTAMHQAGYRGAITVEISKMVQNRADYDPAVTAARSFQTLAAAAGQAGVPLAHR